MTRSLLLLRHGKSDWQHDRGGDRARPVAERGVRAARAIGRFLTDAGQVPDVAVTSPAVRARDTLQLVVEAGRWACELREAEALYGAEPSDVLELLRAEPDTTERLLLVGHEPSWSQTVATLVGGGTHRVPTCAAVGIDLDVDSWAAVRPGTGRLVFLLPPRMLGGPADR